MDQVTEILLDGNLTRESLEMLLNVRGEAMQTLFTHAAKIKKQYVGNIVYFRGLIELSNICSKNCYYCGIRSGNRKPQRFLVKEDEVMQAVKFAYDHEFGSMVMQSGELTNRRFVSYVTRLLKKIKETTDNRLGVTLSMGEQPEEVYREWFDAGAHRYLLRIESSNPDLYYRIHPRNKKHDFDNRMNSLRMLRKIGYNVGTGVMIGLPFQTAGDLANDLLFFREMDIDMAGMGPYIEHKDTPLYQYKDMLLPKRERFYLSLRMVALLRILMKDINIAATTAMQTLDKQGREKALKVGANIIMPNLTPQKYRGDYLLYEDKPCIDEDAIQCQKCLEARIQMVGDKIGFGQWGDSRHFATRTGKQISL